MRTLKLHANKRIKKYLHFAPFQYLRSFLIYISTYFLCCWHKLIIEDRSGSTAELSSDCENQWIMKWPRSLASQLCNLLFFSSFGDKFYIDLKLCLSHSLFDYSHLSIFCIFFLCALEGAAKDRRRGEANTIMRLNFSFFFPCVFTAFV